MDLQKHDETLEQQAMELSDELLEKVVGGYSEHGRDDGHGHRGHGWNWGHGHNHDHGHWHGWHHGHGHGWLGGIL